MRAGILILVLSIALPVAGIAATIHVPADHSSIQQAIDATGPGDTVLVGPGTYWENISFNGKAITVTSSDGPMKTYIDGSSPPHPDFGSVVFFGTWEGPGSVLDGFTVRLGTGTKILHDKRAGGGVFCKNASPTLSNNFIKINTATYGAGIYCSNASPSIKDCWFAANNGSFGSGIYCGEGSSPEIVNNVFYDNSGLGGGEGIACFSCSPLIEGNTISTHLSCGIRCNGYCSAVIKGNTITENKSSGILCEDGATPLIIDNVIDGNEGNDGAGILCDGANPQIKNNVIRNNKADEEGGGIACMKTKDMIISGNTISNNKAKFEGGGIYCSYGSIIVTDCTITNNKGYYGGGLCVYNQSDALLVGNDISHNQADQKGGGIYCEDSSTTVFECCTLHNNHAHGNGGGICCENESSITVLGCKLSNNSTYKDGGGICCIDEGSAVVKDCLIRNNSGESAGGFLCAHSRAIITGNVIIDNKGGERCGGLYVHFCEKVPQPDVSFNTVLRNTADLGAGIYLAGTDPIFTNNIIADNHAVEEGGGMFIFSSTKGSYSNNTITRNSAGKLGGGIYFDFSCDATFTNFILRDNKAPRSPDYYIGVTCDPVFNHSIIDGSFPGSGNIDADPCFVDPQGGDYHICFDSPCRDSGDNSSVLAILDFEGDPRVHDGFVDMGADEFHSHLYYMGDATPGGMVVGKIIGYPEIEPVGLFVGLSLLDPPLPTAWGNFHIQWPWWLYVMPAVPSNGASFLRTELPETPAAPYDLPMQAIIGPELTNLCVLEVR
ncbi:MAG: right-handed parallel beta-helix repeat-containing protein [Planctomycetota bacterium]